MRRSIQFNRKVTLDTEKVDNIATYAVLPAELLSEELSSLKVFPQNRFSCSGIVS